MLIQLHARRTALASSAGTILAALWVWSASWFVGWRLSTMNVAENINAITALVGALGITLPVVYGIYLKLNQQAIENTQKIEKLRQEADASKIKQELTWKGIVNRGFLEAAQKKHLMKTATPDGRVCWMVSPTAKAAFDPIILDLRQLVADMTVDGAPPSESALAWAIEERYSDWMLDRICTAIDVHDNGCTAIAMVLARETDSLLPPARG